MKRKLAGIGMGLALILGGAAFARAATVLNAQMQEYVNGLLKEAQKHDPGVKSFSAEEGKRFFNSKRKHSVEKDVRSCSGCHTSNPLNKGKTPVGKVIEPISPAANKERLTDAQKVEKWFKRNCQNVLERECSAKEKGDFIAYQTSL